MIRVLLLTALATLAACGADGPPVAPGASASDGSGLTISGCVAVGVSNTPAGPGRADC